MLRHVIHRLRPPRHADLADHLELYGRILDRNPQTVDFDHVVANSKRIGFLLSRADAVTHWRNIPPFFTGKELVFCDDPGWDRADIYFVSGIGQRAIAWLKRLESLSAPCFVIEETFIKSIVPGAWGRAGVNLPLEYFHPVAYILDSRGPAFYSARRSQLEHLIDSPAELSNEERRRAHRVIETIVNNGVSKYNCQEFELPRFRRSSSDKVLVIDQTDGDLAVSLSDGDRGTFDRMLECAIDENPGAEVIVKTHVDRRSRPTYYSQRRLPRSVTLWDRPANPIAALRAVDVVYTFSSTMGWEGVMCGKTVHTFGSPIYAGWGLTNDRRQLGDRRARSRTLEELFHFIYMSSSVYAHPTLGRWEIEDAIEYLVRQRNQFFTLR